MSRKRLIGVVAAICALAAVTAAIAQGSGTTKSSSAKGKSSTARAAQAPGSPGPPGAMGGPDGGMHGPDGGAVHSVSVIPDKAGTSFITLTSDRGTVKSVDSAGGTITIEEGTKSATYKTLTLTVPSSAKVIRDGKTAALAEVKAEDHVSVSSSTEGTTVFAMDASFRPEHGPGRGGPPGMGGPPPGQEASGAEAKSGTGTKTGTGTTTTTE
jgi:hypothetical protein